MNQTIPILIFSAVLVIAGTMETTEQQDKFNYCLKSGAFITDMDIEQRIQECEARTGYDLPDNLHP